jgi:hypothetical protein
MARDSDRQNTIKSCFHLYDLPRRIFPVPIAQISARPSQAASLPALIALPRAAGNVDIRLASSIETSAGCQADGKGAIYPDGVVAITKIGR